MRKWIPVLLLVIAVAYVRWGDWSTLIHGGTPGSTEYVVQPGDTLAGIAARYGVTVDELVALNRDRYPSLAERPDLIRPGWELRVPARRPDASPADVREKAEQLVAYIDALALTATAPEPEPTPTPDFIAVTYYYYQHPRDPEIVAREIFELTNAERVKRGLKPLVWDDELAQIARWRVQDMVERGYYSHYDPQTGELLFAKRCATCGENLAEGYVPTGRAFVDMWLGSPGHRANMLDPQWTAIGVGVARRRATYVAVQVFR